MAEMASRLRWKSQWVQWVQFSQECADWCNRELCQKLTIKMGL